GGLLPEIVASSLLLARGHSAGHATSSGRLIPIGCAPQISEQGKEIWLIEPTRLRGYVSISIPARFSPSSAAGSVIGPKARTPAVARRCAPISSMISSPPSPHSTSPPA